jgi:surface protein
MSKMFENASECNQSLNEWNVSNVVDMHLMFAMATSFNQPLESWDVAKVRNMRQMFLGASEFNPSISPLEVWAIHPDCDVSWMMFGTYQFNQEHFVAK